MHQENLNEALIAQNQCLHIRLTIFGHHHPEPAAAKVNIGRIYESMGEYEKVLDTYNEALQALEATLGCKHPLVLNAYNKYKSNHLALHALFWHCYALVCVCSVSEVYRKLGENEKARKYQNIFLNRCRRG